MGRDGRIKEPGSRPVHGRRGVERGQKQVARHNEEAQKAARKLRAAREKVQLDRRRELDRL